MIPRGSTLIPPLTPRNALIYGTLFMGSADILEVSVFYGLRGVPVARVVQAISSGLLGRAAFTGGAATALLGLALHFFIAFTVVAVYLAASRRLPELAAQPFLYGPLYGLVVYGVMNHVVVPLSAAPVGPKPVIAYVNAVLVHVVVIGLLTALFAQAAQGAEPEGVSERAFT
jgi:hypothetical protein